MPFLSNRSIKTRLVLVSTSAAAAALLVCSAALIAGHLRTLRVSRQVQLETVAEVLRFNSTAALSSRDSAAGQRLLESLRLQASVEAACLYDRDRRVLASYARDGRTAAPLPSPHTDSCRINPSGQIEVFRRVSDWGEEVGTLYLRADASDFRVHVWRYTLIVGAVIVFALAVSMVLSTLLQGWIAGPIRCLAVAAEKITATGDYSVRVEHQSADEEMARVYAAVNRMLDRIETADKALKAAQEQLEQRVVERTTQLREEIAQRERTQRELEQAKNAAEEASRAKSGFLANMSHEIRTPLNAILGFTDLLMRGADRGNENDRHDYLNTIHSSGKHLLSLINDILDLSKIEAGKFPVENVRFSPLTLFEEVVSVLRVRAHEKGLSLEWEWRGQAPGLILSDPERLRQLLVNLVGNAIKFTERGGIRITGRIDARGDQRQCIIQVADTGIGIPPEKREAIFDPFIQADSSVTRKYGGTGLGLAISRRIAEALGGSLTMESEMGKGSVFTARIACGTSEPTRRDPLPVPVDTAASAPPASEPAPPPRPGARILLVEDGDTNRKLIQIVLTRAGLVVETAENGQIGMERALREPFDLILMDMQMPVMDGYTATMFLREEGYSGPIVALTAHAMKGDEVKCQQAGCSDYLSKPVDSDLLLSTISRWLARGDLKDHALAEAAGSPSPVATERAAPPPLVSRLPIDDPEFREIVLAFIERFRQQLQVMHEAWQAGRLEELGRLAHWLKGSGGTAGFPILTETARALGKALHEGDEAGVEEKLAELSRLSTRLALPEEPLAAAGGLSPASRNRS